MANKKLLAQALNSPSIDPKEYTRMYGDDPVRTDPAFRAAIEAGQMIAEPFSHGIPEEYMFDVRNDPTFRGSMEAGAADAEPILQALMGKWYRSPAERAKQTNKDAAPRGNSLIGRTLLRAVGATNQGKEHIPGSTLASELMGGAKKVGQKASSGASDLVQLLLGQQKAQAKGK